MNATPRVSFSISKERIGPGLAARPAVAVAIPVKDEEARIGVCIAALAGQVDLSCCS